MPAGFVSEIGGGSDALSLPYGGRLTPVFTLKLLLGRVPASLRHWFDPMPLQWCCGQYCVRDWTVRPGCAGNPDPGSPRHSNHQRLDLGGDGRSLRRGRIFLAISFRCQANSLSGVTMVATSARSFRPNPLDLAANRRTWSSFNRSRRH
jgi:hypothetical protein